MPATLYDGEAKRPALLCPELHHGFIYGFKYEVGKATFKELSGHGNPMIIPEHYITWKHELKANVQELLADEDSSRNNNQE